MDELSKYKRSVLWIFLTQYIGRVVSIVAPTCRCFRALNFRKSKNWPRNQLNVFKVEKCWTQTTLEWKLTDLAFKYIGNRFRRGVYIFKNAILYVHTRLLRATVVTCKIMQLLTNCLVIFEGIKGDVIWSSKSSNCV